MRKTLWTLNIENYAPELCEFTYPLLKNYADKMGADFQIINERRFPEMPVVYEKLQIFYLGRGNDWNVYIDSDAIVFPDMFDVTETLTKDTVAHYGRDFAYNRWRYDDFFRRDGRNIGSCNWFSIASDWCIDLWHPLDDLSLAQAVEAIRPIAKERMAGIVPSHLIDDYVLSRNIARFGLKFASVIDMLKARNDPGMYVWHTHTETVQQKTAHARQAWETLKPLGLKKLSLHDWLSRHGTTTPPPEQKYGKKHKENGFVPDITRAIKIFGWMSPSELFWLGEQAHKHRKIVEVGSFHGRSTRALADNTDGIVEAVDTWEGSPEHKGMPETENMIEKFLVNLDDLLSEKVKVIKSESLNAAELFARNEARVDMVFLDAMHDYESVKADILAWKPLLAPGGLLCGHDFGDVPNENVKADGEWGVTRAVQELLPGFQRGPGSLWYVEL